MESVIVGCIVSNNPIFAIARIARSIFREGNGKRVFAAMIPLQAYLDDSSDGKKEQVVCAGAVVGNELNWPLLEEAWLERLKQDEIEYFRTTECKGVHGAFYKLRRKYGYSGAQAIARKLRDDLEAILLAHPWYGFGIAALVSDYLEVWNSVPDAKLFYREDPTEATFSTIFFEIAAHAQDISPEYQVAYIIDDSSYSGIIAEAFKGLKHNHPNLPIARLAPLDDKKTPALQMADLFANITKDSFLQWLIDGKPKITGFDHKWQNHVAVLGRWDKEHMLKSIEKNLKDPRYAAGLFPKRSTQKFKRQLRHDEKMRRKALIKSIGARNEK